MLPDVIQLGVVRRRMRYKDHFLLLGNLQCFSELFEFLIDHLKTSSTMPYISVNWSDGEVPPMSKDFITSLANFVREGNNILVHCVGGHGRTGTLLMCLLLREGYTGDVLFWLRKNYCKKAVETKRQIEYLQSAYQLKTKQTPSQTSYVMGTGTGTAGIVGWE